MALIHDFFNYNDPVKSSKDESNAESSFFFVQMKLYADQFKKLEAHIQLTRKEIIAGLMKYAASLSFTENFVRRIIMHYNESSLPCEQDLEPIDINEFPSDKEIKRFFRTKHHKRFYYTDRYSNAQPPEEEKEKELQKFKDYFKLLKAHAYDYYPQLGKLPARGLRETERTLYTLSYIYVLDLYETINRMQGIQTERTEFIDRQYEEYKQAQIRKKAKQKGEESFFDKLGKMSDKEKEDRDRKIEERIALEEQFGFFHDDFILITTNAFLKLFPAEGIYKENFLAKAADCCYGDSEECFYMCIQLFDHYNYSEEPMKNWYEARELKPVYKRYLKSKQEFPKTMNSEIFKSTLDDFDKGFFQKELNIQTMKRYVLQAVNIHFPRIHLLPASGIREIEHMAETIAFVTIMDLQLARDKVKGENKDFIDKLDKRTEAFLRDKELNG